MLYGNYHFKKVSGSCRYINYIVVEMFKLCVDLRSIESSYCVFGIARIFELYECETRRISGNPYVTKWPIFTEGTLDFVLAGRRPQIPHVHLTRKIPFPIARHSVRKKTRERPKAKIYHLHLILNKKI